MPRSIRIRRHWGVTRRARHECNQSIEEMHHALWLIDHILHLDGLPNMQRLNQVLVGQSVEEILKADQTIEHKAMGDLREAIAYCESVRDFVSRDLFQRILIDEEKHADFLDTQFDPIGRIGIERYTLLNAAAAPEQE